ncbi:MAG: hypothetical protein JWM27_1459 [Gemmatimonadetes bacterium]|nr:hypothetical protein [Gemmatimonadota bacterium]
MRRFSFLPPLALAAALAAGACERRPDTITRGRFIAANVALRSVNDSGPRADSLRAAALKRWRVTPAQLRQYVRANGSRTGELAKAWSAIDDTLQKRLAAPPPSSAPTPEVVPPVSKPGAPGGPPIHPRKPRVRPPAGVRYPPATLQEPGAHRVPRAAVPPLPVSGPPPATRPVPMNVPPSGGLPPLGNRRAAKPDSARPPR